MHVYKTYNTEYSLVGNLFVYIYIYIYSFCFTRHAGQYIVSDRNQQWLNCQKFILSLIKAKC